MEHLLGAFEDGKLVPAPLSSVRERYAQLAAQPASGPELNALLRAAKNPAHYPALHEAYLALTEQLLREAWGPNEHLSSLVGLLEELDGALASLSKRLRDWYALIVPELGASVADNAKFVELVATKSPDAILADLRLPSTMGRPAPGPVESAQAFAHILHQLFQERTRLEAEVEATMRAHCPNLLALAGAAIGSRLLRAAGGLARLSAMRAGTVQLLGAERALFRHLRNKKARPPKHGLIINHPLVARSKDKGKAARALADKLAIAAKVDYFKGQFVGEQLRQELEARFP